ncbi:hypothetical protein X802_02845 [Thermococcus guaymasensis DSM 11113]|uniref:Helicase HerA central domain-containing protein n=1 Tax=Thermococcus guaymasensis DSM 11113 TaxID=1432656 RepID=A0A0X1KJ14_9EURY|nr:hypothetical protein X802_02845 [Thermococcus guaymasensis DSM 11113]
MGIVLSGSTTTLVKAQPLEDSGSRVREGMFVIIKTKDRRELLGRVVSIVHYHEFFEEGDIWSEARQKGEDIPLNVARRYTTVHIELLGELKGGSIFSISQPPFPGDPIYPLSQQDIEKIYGQGSEELLREFNFKPTATPFGTIYGYEDLPAVLNINNITMHMAILGITGSGKSNTTGYLLEQLSRLNSSVYPAVPVIIIDANGDYIDYTLPENRKEVKSYSMIKRFVFPKSSAVIRHEENIDILTIDLNVFNERELSELVIAYYKRGNLEGAEQQVSLLHNVLASREFHEYAKEKGAEYAGSQAGIDFNSVFSDNLVSKYLDEDSELKKVYHSATIGAVKRALSVFHEDIVKSSCIIPYDYSGATLNVDLIDEMTKPRSPGMVIIDFSSDGATGIYPEVKQFVVYYILKLLYNKFVEYKTRIDQKERLLLFVIEEAQNYAPNKSKYPVGFSVAKDILATIATQGRKFGLSLCLVTQRPSFVDPIVMSMVNTFIIHRVSPEDVKFVETVTGGLPPFISKKLTLLERGLAVLAGQMNRFGFPLLVKIPARRVEHSIGRVRIFEEGDENA